MRTEKRILLSELRDAGVLDAYIGLDVEDVECSETSAKAVLKYMAWLEKRRQSGTGMFLHGDTRCGKSALANLVAQSAFACNFSAQVISLSFLSAVRFGGGFEGGKDSADRFFKKSFMDMLQVDFLVIDDLCDPLMEERANYYLKATFHDTVKYRAAMKAPLIVTTRLDFTDTTPSIASLFGESIADTLRSKCVDIFVSK